MLLVSCVVTMETAEKVGGKMILFIQQIIAC